MARQADDSLQQEFGLPLGLIVIDTIAACAGYARAGDENDPAAGQAVMNVLKALAQALGCFVLGVDHFGKNLEAGTRGASSKEAASDLVLACLGDKELSGSVVNTRLAVRKNRGGQQGQEYPVHAARRGGAGAGRGRRAGHHHGGGLAAASPGGSSCPAGSLAAMPPTGSAARRCCGSSGC